MNNLNTFNKGHNKLSGLNSYEPLSKNIHFNYSSRPFINKNRQKSLTSTNYFSNVGSKIKGDNKVQAKILSLLNI